MIATAAAAKTRAADSHWVRECSVSAYIRFLAASDDQDGLVRQQGFRQDYARPIAILAATRDAQSFEWTAPDL